MMEKMKKLSEKQPILYCVLAELAFIVVLLLLDQVLGFVDIAPNTYIKACIGELILVLCGLVFMKGAGQDYVLKCKTKGFGTGLLTGGYFLVMGLFSFSLFGFLCLNWDLYVEMGMADQLIQQGIDFTGYEAQSGLCIVSFILYMLLVGLAEEFTYRGVIAELLLKNYGKDSKGVVKAVILSGILFGSMHIANGISTGLTACLVQAVMTAFMGMVFTLVYYKSGNIYAVALLHAILDFGALAWRGGFYASTTSGLTDAMHYNASNLVGIIPYLIVALFLMRKKNMEKILARVN